MDLNILKKYCIDESTLLGVEYNIINKEVSFIVDFFRSIEHPQYKYNFDKVEIILSGVQYYKNIVSHNITDYGINSASLGELEYGDISDIQIIPINTYQDYFCVFVLMIINLYLLMVLLTLWIMTSIHYLKIKHSLFYILLCIVR